MTEIAPHGEAGGVKAESRPLVIVPCFNESASIAGVLADLRTYLPDADILVIDDGSTDFTHLQVTEPARCLRLPVNLGIGGAVQTGLIYAARHGHEFCVQVDGDGQHPARVLPDLLRAARQTGADILIGSRYLSTSGGDQSSAPRRMGGRVIGAALLLCFGGARISDPTSGMRVMSRRAIRLFAQHYPADFPEPVSLAWGRARGFAIAEMPVAMRPRQGGVSSLGGLRGVSYMVRVVTAILLARISVPLGKQ